MRLMLVAGEVSGDAHGEALLSELRALIPDLETFGIGGSGMLAQGLRPYCMIDSLQAHGLIELVRHLPRLYSTLGQMKDALRAEKPDALLLIDYPGFNLKLAEYAHGLKVPVIFFNSPQIWAWRRGRLKTIRRVVDRMIVLFPFETAIYEDAGIPVNWVGHPLVDEHVSTEDLNSFQTEYAIDPELPVLTLAPGSRPSEMARHLHVLLGALPEIARKVPGLQVLLPVAGTVDEEAVRKQVQGSSVRVSVVPGNFISAIHSCDAAVVASGTAALQTGLALKPFVIIYRVSALTYWIARKMSQVSHIGMVNLLAGREIVPELLQQDFRSDRVAESAVSLLNNQQRRDTIIDSLKNIRGKLGDPGAYRRAAETIRDFLAEHCQ